MTLCRRLRDTYGQGCTLSIHFIPAVACKREGFNSCLTFWLFICCSLKASYTPPFVSADSNTRAPHPAITTKSKHRLERMVISGFNSTEVKQHNKKPEKTLHRHLNDMDSLDNFSLNKN